MKTVLRLGLIPLVLAGCAKSATDLSSASSSSNVASSFKADSSKDNSSRGDVGVASCAKPPPRQPTDADACLHLSAALVGLEDTDVSLSGNANVDGNAYIGSESSLKASGNVVIAGSLYSGSRRNSIRLTGNSVIRGGIKSTSDEFDERLEHFSHEMGELRATLNLNSIEKSTVIKGAGGRNVVHIRGGIELSGTNSIVLQGSATDAFILNVDGEFEMSGNSSIVLAGGVQPEHVLINLLGKGEREGEHERDHDGDRDGDHDGDHDRDQRGEHQGEHQDAGDRDDDHGGRCEQGEEHEEGVKLSGSSIVNGTILAVDRSAQVTGNGRINGALVASKHIQISGNGFTMKSALFCASAPGTTPPPVPAPSATPVPPTPVEPPVTAPTPKPPVPPMPTATPMPPSPPAPTPAPTAPPVKPPVPPMPTATPVNPPMPPVPPAPTATPMPPAPTATPVNPPMPPAPPAPTATPIPPAPTPAPTATPPQPTPPPVVGATITNFSVLEVFFDGFSVQWTTSEGASSQVMWTNTLTGETGVTAVDATLQTNHLLHISGLNSSTDYKLQAVSTNAAGITSASAVISAQTAN